MTSRVRAGCEAILQAEQELGPLMTDVIFVTVHYVFLMATVIAVWNKDKVRRYYDTKFWETIVVVGLIVITAGKVNHLILDWVERGAWAVFWMFAAFAVGL
jgi:hypothetical protein